MTYGDWIGLGALLTTITIGAFGYFRKPSFVPISRAELLEKRIKELDKENETLKKDIERLGNANWQLERSRQFWQDEYERVLKER